MSHSAEHRMQGARVEPGRKWKGSVHHGRFRNPMKSVFVVVTNGIILLVKTPEVFKYCIRAETDSGGIILLRDAVTYLSGMALSP